MILKRDGKEIMRGTEQEIWAYLHQMQSSSVSWALKYEGYSIEEE